MALRRCPGSVVTGEPGSVVTATMLYIGDIIIVRNYFRNGSGESEEHGSANVANDTNNLQFNPLALVYLLIDFNSRGREKEREGLRQANSAVIVLVVLCQVYLGGNIFDAIGLAPSDLR